jgi:hypothetical protein
LNKPRIAIAALALALVASNAWWAYRLLDAGISLTYSRASQEATSELLSQILAVLPIVAKPGASRSEVLAAARIPNDPTGPFQKEGFVWVGQLGLQFNEQGRFVKAIAGPSAPGQ